MDDIDDLLLSFREDPNAAQCLSDTIVRADQRFIIRS